MYIDINSLQIRLDSSVKHLTKVACMALSGTIENGLMLTCNPNATIVIFKDRIDFGQCLNPDLSGFSGLIFPNFYKEYNNIVYRFGSNFKCSFWNKTIDYVGIMPPETPDNEQLFHIIFPRFS